MLLKLLLSLAALFSHHGHRNSEQHDEFEPTAHGPLSFEEEAATREALHGEHFGGDMVFSNEWNTTDAGIKDPKFRWPGYPGGGVVPYVITSDFNANDRRVILQGMEEYHKHTCIKFVPRTNEKDYIEIFKAIGCWSLIGKSGGKQQLSLGRGCVRVGLVIHELGHAIGLFHEHQRSDRDQYIDVYLQNVVRGQQHNFVVTDKNKELIFTSYDYDSIMHYGSYAFSKRPTGSNPLPTMKAKNGHKLIEPYERSSFANSDITTIKNLYKC